MIFAAFLCWNPNFKHKMKLMGHDLFFMNLCWLLVVIAFFSKCHRPYCLTALSAELLVVNVKVSFCSFRILYPFKIDIWPLLVFWTLFVFSLITSKRRQCFCNVQVLCEPLGIITVGSETWNYLMRMDAHFLLYQLSWALYSS